MALRQFQFAVARFMPDPIRGEAFNIGVVIHDLKSGHVIPRFSKHLARLECLEPTVDLRTLSTVVDYFQDGLTQAGQEKGFLERATATGSGMIAFSPVRGGLTKDLVTELADLYERYISIDWHAPIKPTRRSPLRLHQLTRQVRDAFDRSGNAVLQRMKEQAVFLPDLVIKFPFVDLQENEPPRVVQPVTLDVGTDEFKVASAKEFAFNATQVKLEDPRYRNARMVALIYKPPGDQHRQAFEEAEASLKRAYKVVRVTAPERYMSEVRRELQLP